MAAMQFDPLPETVYVAVFMRGLRTGVARTEVFRAHPSTFEEAVNIAHNADHNFRSARIGWNGYNSSFARATSAIIQATVILNQWVLAMLKMKVKRSFMLKSNERK